MKKTKIGQILTQLLAEKNIRVSQLARSINIPQPTIYRIATGLCEHPHMSSLKPIADFFSISIDQLKGFEPLHKTEAASKVPLLCWDQLNTWPETKNFESNEFVSVPDVNVSRQSYALKVIDTSMDPIFPKHTLLIIDPIKRVRDRSYVIAKLKRSETPVFRQLLIDAEDYYLKPLSLENDIYKVIQMSSYDSILGIVVQARRNYEE